MKPNAVKANLKMVETLERIAREQLRLETLETRHADDLDFHELAVWVISDALEAAYKAGRRAAK